MRNITAKPVYDVRLSTLHIGADGAPLIEMQQAGHLYVELYSEAEVLRFAEQMSRKARHIFAENVPEAVRLALADPAPSRQLAAAE